MKREPTGRSPWWVLMAAVVLVVLLATSVGEGERPSVGVALAAPDNARPTPKRTVVVPTATPEPAATSTPTATTSTAAPADVVGATATATPTAMVPTATPTSIATAIPTATPTSPPSPSGTALPADTPTPTSAAGTTATATPIGAVATATPTATAAPTKVIGALPNDDFGSAVPITGLPFTAALDTTSATSASDDPDLGIGAGAGSATVWYQVVAPGGGSLRAGTAGSSYDTVLVAYTGSRGSLAMVAGNDDAGLTTLQSEVVFNVQSGTTYFLEVGGYGDTGGGSLQLSVEYSSSAAPTATPEPTSAPSPTPTATYGAWYWGVPNYTPQPTAVVGPAPSNDDIGSAIVIDSLPFSSIVNTTGATGAADDPGMTTGTDKNSNTVWYRLVAPSEGSVSAATLGSDYDTVLAVFTGTRGNLALVASNDDAPPTVQSEVGFNVQAGVAYYLEVAQYGAPPMGGSLALRVDWSSGLASASPYGTPAVFGTPGVAATGGSVPSSARLSGRAAQDARYFAQTGYRVGLDPFWDYFQKRGGVATFGYPISWEFTLLGFKVQLFQRGILQLMPDGSVATMNLLDEGLMPYTQVNFSSFPAPERDLIDSAPSPQEPGYGEKAISFVQANVPDEWDGMPVGFQQGFLSTVRYEDAFPNAEGDAGLLPLLDLELWGLPTSRPAYDPANHDFVYQRFQRGIMHYDRRTGTTQGLLLADYLKSLMTGRNLPADLEQQATDSRFYRQYAPGKAGSLARPARLPGTNLDNAFEPSLSEETATPAAAAPTATPRAKATPRVGR